MAGVAHAVGRELWTSDGTSAGTRRVAEIRPGAAGSHPEPFAAIGAKLVFAARDAVHGREPWVLPIADAGGWLARPYGNGCSATVDVPRIEGNGPARVASAGFAAIVRDAPASAGLRMLAGARPDRTPLAGSCTLWLADPFPIATTRTDAAGIARVPVPIPNDPTLVGVEFRLQALVAQPGGPLVGALATTGGLHVSIGT